MDRIRKWLRQVPIPAAFVICGMAALLSALSLTRATIWFAQKNKGEIAANYAEAELLGREQQPDSSRADLQLIPSTEIPQEDARKDSQGSSDVPGEKESPAQVVPSESRQEAVLYVLSPNAEVLLPEEDRERYRFYDNLDNTAAILWYSLCLCLASLVFYLWKIKKPLRILNRAAEKISDNDLSFHIDYTGRDELGRLCQAFESMRQELAENNRRMWNSAEERKRLNAAFAHDLRTPLTVLQGHTDLLLDTLDDGRNADPEMLASVRAISNQVSRMNSYLDAMSSLRRLEDYEPCLKTVSSEALTELLEETAASLFSGEKKDSAGSIRTTVLSEICGKELWMDKEAFSRIYENLLSNAARYARENIGIRLYREQDFVVLEVADDGRGFTVKDLRNASAPYYRGERSEPASSSHFGLGLYICSLLAEKLGGGIQLSNGGDGGAKVTVRIKICEI